MMKRKFLAVVLPIVGCATVVGSGFSAWYFGATASSPEEESFNIGTNVTEEINSVAGTLSIPSANSNASTLNGMNLILDQGGYGNTEEKQGIMFANGTPSVVSKNDLDYHFNVVFKGTETLDLKDVYNAGMELKVTVSINLGDKFSQYITVKDDARMVGGVGQTDDEGKFTKGEGNVYTATYTLKETSLDDIDYLDYAAVFKFSINLSTDDLFQNSLFVYVNDMKPTDSDTLGDMRRIINEGLTGGQKITFSTVATIE